MWVHHSWLWSQRQIMYLHDETWAPSMRTHQLIQPLIQKQANVTLLQQINHYASITFRQNIIIHISVWYKTKFGSQNFGYQIWFCTRLYIGTISYIIDFIALRGFIFIYLSKKIIARIMISSMPTEYTFWNSLEWMAQTHQFIKLRCWNSHQSMIFRWSIKSTMLKRNP